MEEQRIKNIKKPKDEEIFGESSKRFSFVYLFLLTSFTGISCGGPASPVRITEEYRAPTCSPNQGPSNEELERKKQDLFDDIQNSNRYNSQSAKKEVLKNYKNLIRTKEKTSCPEEVERFIEGIADLFRRES